MKAAVRTTGTTVIALAGAALLGLGTAAPPPAALAARTSVLVMGGSGDPLTSDTDGLDFVSRYLGKAVSNVVAPAARRGTGIPDAGPDGYNEVAIITPAQFYPDSALTFDQSVHRGLVNLDNCVRSSPSGCSYNHDVAGSVAPGAGDALVVYGFSQSATIGTLEKRALAAEYGPDAGPEVSFTLIGNGNRPNGGFLARGPEGFTIPLGFPFGGVTFSGPTPTDTRYQTVDVAIQYDYWADHPADPLNRLAILNAKMGQRQRHPHYPDQSLDDPGIIDQGRYGDTQYYLVATGILPLVAPLARIPGIGRALADLLDAPLRVIVESAYDRSTSPGVPRRSSLFRDRRPVRLIANLAAAIPTGVDNAAEDLFRVRPLGTTRPGPYGVGGRAVTWLNQPVSATEPHAGPARLSTGDGTRRHGKGRDANSGDAQAGDAQAGDVEAGDVTDPRSSGRTSLRRGSHPVSHSVTPRRFTPLRSALGSGHAVAAAAEHAEKPHGTEGNANTGSGDDHGGHAAK